MLACLYREYSRAVTHQFLDVGLFVWRAFKGSNSPVSRCWPVWPAPAGVDSALSASSHGSSPASLSTGEEKCQLQASVMIK